uniref:Uncharacterized protein n=1 Tax=Arundo donax TaxID=35708 RepID=A0A0A9C200_ARUDO
MTLLTQYLLFERMVGVLLIFIVEGGKQKFMGLQHHPTIADHVQLNK